MDRQWLLTWSTYGSRLPGDDRGFVSNLFHERPCERRHNVVGTPFTAAIPELEAIARENLKCPPVSLNLEQASALLTQFHETAAYRGWTLCAVAIMEQHIHVVVGVEGDPAGKVLLRDMKCYGSRALNRRWARPASDTWWTECGSRRVSKGEANLIAAIRYVASQPRPLLIWIAPRFRSAVADILGAER